MFAVAVRGASMRREHRRVVRHAQVVANRKRRAVSIQMMVPTAVRVEAGWDRTSPAWVLPNRLRIADSPLDAASANTAASIRDRTGVSRADSQMGTVIQSATRRRHLSSAALRPWVENRPGLESVEVGAE